jgi:hypothetical protein
MTQLQGRHGHEEKQGQQDRCGAGDDAVRPLALSFQPRMGLGLLKGHLDRSAHDDPRQDLRWRGLQIGTENGLETQFAFGIAH